MRTRPVIMFALSVSLVGASAAPSAADATTQYRAEGSAVGSASVPGTPVIGGHLLDEHGAPTAGRLTLVALPRMEVLAASSTGDAVKATTVASGVSSDDGRFALTMQPSTPLSEFMESDGTINFTLFAQTDSGSTTRALARRLDASLGLWTASAAASDAPDSVTLRIGRLAGAPANGIPVPMRTDRFCNWYEMATYDNVPVGLNEVYTGPSASGQYVYTTGASSDLGVGFSVSGNYGSYSQSGTSSASSSFTLTYPNWGPNNSYYHLTSWQYKKYEVWLWNGSYCYFWGYEIRPTAFQGSGTYWALGSPPTADNCANYNPGMGVEKVTNAAQTWTNGVDLQAFVGLSVSSKTGWFDQSKISFYFSTYGRLCGTNALPPDAARVVGKGP